jgi:YNFM family putative membrane transporter
LIVELHQVLLGRFICNFLILFVGMGLFPLLPLYAAGFGATPAVVGLYLAITYVSIAVGTMLTGWLAQYLTRRGLLVAVGILGIPALVLLGQAAALWQVVLLTSVVWFSGGLGLTTVSVFTGLLAAGKSRGKSFSLMSLGSPLGAVIGGTTVGQLVAWQGYPLMFAVVGATWIAIPLVGLLGLKDIPAARPAPSAARMGGTGVGLGRTIYFLLLLSLLSAMAVSIGRFGTSLSMHAFDFSPQAVASTATVSGLATIPGVFLIGALSDRLGRKRFLMLGYLLAAGGVLTLIVATHLWHFWLAATLLLVGRNVSRAVAQALATDTLAPEALGRGLPWLNAMDWVAGILSFASAGYLMDTIGAANVFLVAGLLAVAAATLLGLLPQQRQAEPRAERAERAPSRWRIANLVPLHKKI